MINWKWLLSVIICVIVLWFFGFFEMHKHYEIEKIKTYEVICNEKLDIDGDIISIADIKKASGEEYTIFINHSYGSLAVVKK